jgi:hypothetical protein
LKAIGLKEIERILTITEAHGLSREAVVIRLRTATPGALRILSNGKFEIVVDSAIDFDEWINRLEPEIRRLTSPEPR